MAGGKDGGEAVTDKGFRYTIGIISILAGIAALVALYLFKIPTENKDPLLLALGVVLGWGGSVVQSEYGSTSSGRAMAAQNASLVAKAAPGASDTPQPVTVVNTGDDPVPTTQGA